MPNQLPRTMQAAQADNFGDPEVLRIRDVALRPPRANRALVQMTATTVNPIDLEARRGALQFIKQPPFGTGLDVCGHVVAAGSRWNGPPVGTPVWGSLGGLPAKEVMAAAEYVEVRSNWVVAAPTRIPLAESAAMPLTALTAHLGLRFLKIRPGHRLLIRGASGGVGTVAIQLARHLGAHVIALCSPRNDELCLSLGAQETIDYHGLDWNQVTPVDAALDLAGGAEFAGLMQAVKNGGRIAAALPDQPARIIGAVLPGRSPIRPVLAVPSRRRFHELVQLIDLGHLEPVIAERFALAQIAEAHHHMENDKTPGKRVIEISA